ncbi:MFS transporter [Paraburkholderia aromaticivorans]|uniref:MFS transporter n=1 Tax=Paraburkholderia aromaticivorans TaxID=2026199 RepID=UPI001F1023B9|nr:MFS transporter [Paraburkholderia aromaticivorans]
MSHILPTFASQAATTRANVRSRVAGCIGHAIEWFDFSIYANLAIFFGPQLFPSIDQRSALLAAFGVYALGFVMRPVGGWVLGEVADRYGRRTALTVSVTLMAAGSLMIAVLPTYASIGLAAPVIATLARLLQGMSVGGEFAAACSFLAETAPPNRRGFHGSFLFFGTGIGLICASGLTWALTQFLTHDQMLSFGWRIPFFVGALGGLFGYWLRTRVSETQAFEHVAEEQSRSGNGPLRTLMLHHRRQMLTLIGTSILGAFGFYLFIVYVPVYAIHRSGASPETAYSASTWSLIAFTVVQPLFGALSDRLGRRPQLVVMAAAYTLFLYPVVLSVGNTFWSILRVELFGMVLYALYTSIAPAVMAELFDTEVRALGIGLPFNLVVALLGGTTPYLMTWLQGRHQEQLFLIYVCIGSAVSLITYLVMSETVAKPIEKKSMGS